MKIWMTGELQADIYDFYGVAEQKIEKAFNEKFMGKDYGSSLEKIFYLAIILNFESPDFGEVKRYSKRDKTAEFRLKISHEDFLAVSEDMHVKLVIDSIHHAIKLLPTMKIPNFDFAAFEADFVSFCEENGWL